MEGGKEGAGSGLVGVACSVRFSGTPLSPGVLDQPLESDVCRDRERRQRFYSHLIINKLIKLYNKQIKL